MEYSSDQGPSFRREIKIILSMSCAASEMIFASKYWLAAASSSTQSEKWISEAPLRPYREGKERERNAQQSNFRNYTIN